MMERETDLRLSCASNVAAGLLSGSETEIDRSRHEIDRSRHDIREITETADEIAIHAVTGTASALQIVLPLCLYRIRQQINIDDMQFGFMKGRGTTDAIFTVRQMQEKFRAK